MREHGEANPISEPRLKNFTGNAPRALWAYVSRAQIMAQNLSDASRAGVFAESSGGEHTCGQRSNQLRRQLEPLRHS